MLFSGICPSQGGAFFAICGKSPKKPALWRCLFTSQSLHDLFQDPAGHCKYTDSWEQRTVIPNLPSAANIYTPTHKLQLVRVERLYLQPNSDSFWKVHTIQISHTFSGFLMTLLKGQYQGDGKLML